MKGQASIEQLMSIAGLMVLMIPVTFLFMTLTSFQSEEVDTKHLDSSIVTFTNAIEEVYSECATQSITKIASITLPDNTVDLKVDELQLSEDENQFKPYFAVLTFEDGSEIIKRIDIVRHSDKIRNINFDADVSGSGNKKLSVKCKLVNVDPACSIFDAEITIRG